MVEIQKYKKRLWRIKIAGGISYGMVRQLYPPSHVYITDGVQEIRKSREYEEKVRSPNNVQFNKEQYRSPYGKAWSYIKDKCSST